MKIRQSKMHELSINKDNIPFGYEVVDTACKDQAGTYIIINEPFEDSKFEVETDKGNIIVDNIFFEYYKDFESLNGAFHYYYPTRILVESGICKRILRKFRIKNENTSTK